MATLAGDRFGAGDRPEPDVDPDEGVDDAERVVHARVPEEKVREDREELGVEQRRPVEQRRGPGSEALGEAFERVRRFGSRHSTSASAMIANRRAPR
ncbi:hypothetical protein [Halalkalicoccus salilacus]|uniref:hypothetical protein n=1 Tax=Halalkalicoccus sp. GCM10025704 TaxID=3252662 RepID=UPI00361D1EB5